MPRFPHEAVPDGAVFGPHHFYFGVLLALGVVWRISDDYPHREAWVAALDLTVALVGFVLTWQYYPTVGAGLTLLGLTIGLGALTRRGYWGQFGPMVHVGYVLGLAIAFDDAIEHAFGWPTPLDVLWSMWLLRAVRWIEQLGA